MQDPSSAQPQGIPSYGIPNIAVSRRDMLSRCGMGIGALALADIMASIQR